MPHRYFLKFYSNDRSIAVNFYYRGIKQVLRLEVN